MGDEADENPLNFLDRLLDEERHSNLHFGDMRFWKHLEHIDSSHIYNTKSLEYRTIKMMFCEGVFFMIFLFILTAYLITEKAGDLYSSRRQQLDYWGGCTVQGLDRRCRIDDVKDIDSFMDWLRDDFSPLAFTNEDEYASVVMARSVFRLQSGTMYWDPRFVGDTQTSVLIGAIRLRQVRVQYSKDCVIPTEFADIVKDCFADYNPGIQSRLSWAPAWTPEHLKEHYEWQEANVTEQRPFPGKYAVYPGDGFVLDLALNKSGAVTRFHELQAWNWIDERTRAVIIEMNTLNPNVNSFVHSRILFEFPAAGGVFIRQEAFPFRAVQLSLALMAADDFGGSFLYFVMSTGLSILFGAYTGWLIYKNGMRFFFYFWSIVDVLGLLLNFILLMQKVAIFMEADTMPNLHPEVIQNPEMFYPIGNLVPTMEQVVGMQAMLGLITWLRVLKYLTLSRTFLPFVRCFEKMFVGLMLYSVLLCLVLFGFALAIYIGYGTQTGLYSTIWGTFVAVAVAPAGGVNFNVVLEQGDWIGPVIIFLYILLLVLLVLTTFNAIQVDQYSVTSYQINSVNKHKLPGAQGNPTIIFLWTYLCALKGVKLVGKETHEDVGEPEDQEIALTSLPEPVAVKYWRTRKLMMKIKAAAYDEIEAIRAAKRQEAGLLLAEVEKKEDKSMAQKLGNEAMALTAGDEDGIVEYNPDEEEEEEEDENRMPTNAEMAGIIVKRVQLQRMLEDDPAIVDVFETYKAVDVVKRFKVDAGEADDADPFDIVARLQASVAKKLAELERMGAGLGFDEMETLRVMSQELHSALTETQKEWRGELLSILQMASLLSNALIELTKKLEQVQTNHTELAIRAAPLTLNNKK